MQPSLVFLKSITKYSLFFSPDVYKHRRIQHMDVHTRFSQHYIAYERISPTEATL